MRVLSDSELYIMMKIWDNGSPMSLNEISYAVREKDWSENTVRNFLSRIVAKGYLKIEKKVEKTCIFRL